MNDRDAAELVGLMMGTWPNMFVGMDEATSDRAVDQWTADLTRLDHAPAVAAFERLRASEKWPPVYATFIAAYRLEVRRLTPATVAVGDADAGQMAYNAARVRDELAAIETVIRARVGPRRDDPVARGHWHGGPQPCPVCGGMDPRIRTPRLELVP